MPTVQKTNVAFHVTLPSGQTFTFLPVELTSLPIGKDLRSVKLSANFHFLVYKDIYSLTESLMWLQTFSLVRFYLGKQVDLYCILCHHEGSSCRKTEWRMNECVCPLGRGGDELYTRHWLTPGSWSNSPAVQPQSCTAAQRRADDELQQGSQ